MALNWLKKKKESKSKDEAEPDRISVEIKNGQPPEKARPSSPSAPPTLENNKPGDPPPPSSSASDNTGNGLFAKLKRGLAKTRAILTTDIEDLFSGKNRIDDEMLEEIEELLITADIGVQTAMDLMKAITRKAAKIDNAEALKQIIKQEILALIDTNAPPSTAPDHAGKPQIVMVVGVNGVGKTTTIGKLAARKVREGQRVMIAAADTFRAAAIEQLAIWADRAGADLIKHRDNADPAAVAYDSIEAALARDIDTIFVDTAGRLHTKVNLMEELKKIQRTISNKLPGAPHEILLVLDATTGQNAIAQAKMFHESLGITALALTKLDGTAKGGIVVSICRQLQLPLSYIGVGETIDDLQPFNATHFVNALF